MTPEAQPDPPTSWDTASCARLATELSTLRQSLIGHQGRLAPWLAQASPGHRPSAVNLAVGDRSAVEPVGSRRGPALLARNAQALFGAAPKERGVRIMVTLPSSAATDSALVDSLVATGMDIARINCAHDAAGDWAAMAQRVRLAARTQGRAVRVLMDLGGPKLRTGPIAAPPATAASGCWPTRASTCPTPGWTCPP